MIDVGLDIYLAFVDFLHLSFCGGNVVWEKQL